MAGTERTNDGNYAFFFGTYGESESYVREHCKEIEDVLRSRNEVKKVSSDDWYIHVTYYKDYCTNLQGTEEARQEHKERVRALAAQIVEDGTENTTEGGWVVYFNELTGNSVLQLIAQIFQISNTTKLSTALFDACAGEWINGFSKAEFDVSSLTVRDIFGDYNAALFGIWPTSWKCNGMVDPNKFLYFPSLVASIALGIAMIVAIVNLAKRVFEIVFLYLVMPLSMSTLAADDGARFKVWRETFITKIVLAYGAVFSVNVFVLILPLLSQMQIDGIGGFGNSLFLIFMIIGGAMVIPAGMGLFARLFGQGDDSHGGGSFLRSAYYGSRFAGLATLGLAGGILRTGYRGTRGIVRKIRNKKSSGSGDGSDGTSDGGNSSGGGDRYTETPVAAENETDTGGNGESG